jgi:hypothetical protein
MTAPVLPFDPSQSITPQQQMADPMIDAIQQTVQSTIGPTHQDAAPSQANEILAPNPPDFTAYIAEDEQRRLLAAALYGADFPAANTDDPQDADWASWAQTRWGALKGSVEKHMHLVERNRLFRSGQQWVSSRGRGPWREPMKPVDSARVVYNMIDKALDQRLQISTDQRPGFHVEPTSFDPEEKRKAEARQLALESQYDSQNMDEQRQVADFWSQTDGVAFWHTFWDPDAGPWDERMGDVPDQRKPLGDLHTETLRCEQVRVSPNATRTDEPYYVIIRRVIPAMEAAYRYGLSGVNPNANTLPVSSIGDGSGMNRWVLDQTTIGEGDRLRNQDTVEEFTVYVDRQADILPDGLQLIVIGDAVVWGPGPLLFKTIPVVPVRDGSTDPSYFPRPIMEQWIDHQVRINALVSAIVDSVRVNKGGRFISRPGAVVQETFVGGGTSVMEVNGAIGSLDDVIKPVAGFSIGQDVKDQLELEIKAFENASGYNDQSRGQISGDASGRAILAAREQLERVFAPGVQAKAKAFTKWAKIQIAGMAFGYDVPRDLGSVGNGRPDLARQLTREMFDGTADIKVEPETLMPMPRVYRQFMLDNLVDRGFITPQQYLRRIGQALTNDLDTPDEDQHARAMRIAEAIRLRHAVPEMRWQDNEAIHQDVLEREIILQDDLQPDVIAAAQQRWSDLAFQSQEKQGGGMPPAQIPGQPGGASAPSGVSGGSPGASINQPGPQTQPLAASLPSTGATPPQGLGGSQQDDAAHAFETISPQ